MKELEFKPIAAFRLDDDTPFTDYSGYGRTAIRVGTEGKGIPLTSTASYSQRLSNTNLATFVIPGFMRAGTEQRDASITFTIYPIEGDYFYFFNDPDGVDFYWTGVDEVGYYINTGEVVEDYISMPPQKLNVALVYTPRSFTLYLNGEVVSAKELPDLESPQFADSGSDNWYAGWSGSTGSALLNNVCFYSGALSADNVTEIHEYNSRHVIEDVPAAFGGQAIKVSAEVRKPSLEVVWDTKDEWNSGAHEQTVVDGNQLQAQRQDALTVEGKWSNSITFASPVPLSTFHSAYITWEGKSVNIEVSLDNTTWITPVQGKPLSIIPTGFDPTDETLLVRVTFDDGLPEAYLDKFTFRAFTGADADNHIDERTITYTNPAAAWDEYDPNDLEYFWGTRLDGGRLTIGPDPNATVKTMEIWVKLDEPLNVAVSPNISSPTGLYVNGVAGGSFITGEWSLVHYMFSGGVADAFWLEGDMTIGRLAAYPTVFTQDEVTRIVQSYTGYPKSRVDDGATISVSEPSTPATIYDLDWTNQTATP